jgi:hypothetical protein
MNEAGQQGDEADEAFGGTRARSARTARTEVPPHARAAADGRGHRFAAYPRGGLRGTTQHQDDDSGIGV